MPRWLISHPACGLQVRGGKSPHHPPCANENHHSDRGAVFISSNCLLFASEDVLQVPPRLALNRLHGGCSEGTEGPFLPRGRQEAAGRAAHAEGSVCLTMWSPVWDQQPRL